MRFVDWAMPPSRRLDSRLDSRRARPTRGDRRDDAPDASGAPSRTAVPCALVVYSDGTLLESVVHSVSTSGIAWVARRRVQVSPQTIRHAAPDVLVLVARNDADLALLTAIRDAGLVTPVLVVSPCDDESRAVDCFDRGADDHVANSMRPAEFAARLRALARRARAATAGAVSVAEAPSVLTLGDLHVDLKRGVARCAGCPLSLRPREYDLLVALLRHPDAIVTARELLREVWGYAPSVVSRTLATHIYVLRRRLAACSGGATPRIVTVYGRGYRLTLEPR